jgi:hypothetical protein
MSKTSGSAAIREQATGPTFTKNDPAKFKGAGKTSGKTAANGVVSQHTGVVFTTNSTHIPTPNADKPAKLSKVIREGKGDHLPAHGDSKDASTEGTGGGRPHYPLKSSYEKRGR